MSIQSITILCVLLMITASSVASIWWTCSYSTRDHVSYNIFEDTVSGQVSRTPRVRESSVQLVDVNLGAYESIRSRDVASAPTTEPLLAQFVDLDVSKGIKEVEFVITFLTMNYS